jgi:Fic family protein
VEDLKLNQKTLFERNADDIIMARAFSEIEGTLNVENVPTTHKKVKDIYQKKALTDKNDIIVKNMIDAMKFIVKEKPSFNKENLLKLYNILSFNCLDEEDKLKEGAYYRDDYVSIGGFEGAPDSHIEECMDSLFTFVNNPESLKKYEALLPHICHYYILYIHPYFDYNGRTARMVSFWLNYIFDINDAPLFMSEAINDNKKEYYRAITNTRNTYNDLTYFLGYILETAIKYSLVYKNLEEVKEKLSKTGDTLTSTEWGYLKKIIIHNSTGYFTYKDFFEYIHSTMTKQGGLKVLNTFVEYDILIKEVNKKKENIYKVNPEILTYKFQK